MRKVISECIKFDSEYGQLLQALKEGSRYPLVATGLCNGAADALTVSLAADLKKAGKGTVLVICPDEKECAHAVNILNEAGIPSAHFPRRDLTLYNVTASREFEHERLKVLLGIMFREYDAVAVTPDAAAGYTIPPKKLAESLVHANAEDRTDTGELSKKLVAAGYVKAEIAETPGQFAVRGGIIDIYPPYAVYMRGKERRGGSFPVRMELFGDEIERMGIFDPDSQRFLDPVDSFDAAPAKEVLTDAAALGEVREAVEYQIRKNKNEKAADDLRAELDKIENEGVVALPDKYISVIYPERTTFLGYFDDAEVFIRNTRGVYDRLKNAAAEEERVAEELVSGGMIARKYAVYSENAAYFESFCDSETTLHINSISYGFGGRKLGGLFAFRTKHTAGYSGNIRLLGDDLETFMSNGYRVILVVENETEAQNLFDAVRETGTTVYRGSAKEKITVGDMPPSSVLIEVGGECRGYETVIPKIAVLAMYSDMRSYLGRRAETKKKRRRMSGAEIILSYNDLSPGDLVVHEKYGIGRYVGMENLTVGGIGRDYVKIEYAGADRLFIPADQTESVSKYIGAGSEDGNVKLSRFGGTEWAKAKAKARESVKDMAEDLIKLYAGRMRRPGYAFSPDGDFQADFEAGFEYEETESQIQAVGEIKADMEKSAPMDRLLCGDVGYGKTEVAFRAAYKAVLDGKQVAIMVPTTILALQHYQTALTRMRGFPVNIDMLSRFRSAKRQEATLRALARGDVDIIIGTHRLLSPDVKFRDLGLLIIDEEQRFGVAQKEKIKGMGGNIDVLSLSATPIPRTLNMAMGGIRDISVLDEAPEDRQPVQTYVLEYDETIITEAVKRELGRGGQVFYLHNRIEDIDGVAARLAEKVGEARIVTAHGKMDKERLEEIWRDMLLGNIDILVCTTIIETGVDVPNANTLIVDNAHLMGLAQLHQIRGRVGRSARRAYAYFVYPARTALGEIAEKRLEAIKEYAEFGAGFRIALRDLELRGAGNLLGAQQHGHLDAVGYELYVKLLNEAVLDARGEKKEPEKECAMSVDVNAFIPESYVKTQAQRMVLYKRIARISSSEDKRDIIEELSDRFGAPPAPVANLLEVAYARALGKKCDVSKVTQTGKVISAGIGGENVSAWLAAAKKCGLLARTSFSPPVFLIFDLPAGQNVCDCLERLFTTYIETKA